MKNLEKSIIFFVKNFPQSLGRTKLIKSLYLLDCEWYKMYNRTFTGLNYKRDKNGPFDASLYQSLDLLELAGLIVQKPYPHLGGTGYEIIYTGKDDVEIEFDPLAENICRRIIDRLGNAELEEFLQVAYDTAPMKAIKARETEASKLFGEELPMDELIKNPKPLFTWDEVLRAMEDLDLTERGSDEEYNEVIFEEYMSLSKTRERVLNACKEIGEK